MENGLNKRNRVSDLVWLIPAFVFVLSILLVRLHMQTMPMTEIFWSEATDTTMLTDLFTWWKAAAVVAAACLAVVAGIAGHFNRAVQFKKSFLYIPAAVYAVFVLLSLLLSKYKYFALHGMNEHFEGTFVLLAYMIIVVFLANAVDRESRVKAILCCVFAAAVLLGILGVTQSIGRDFFGTVAGQKLITPNSRLDSGMMSWDMIDLLAKMGEKAYDFKFTSGKIYQTVYNINYVPMYLSLLIPLVAAAYIHEGSKSNHKIGLAIAELLAFGLLLYNFLAASSASGYFGLFAALIAAVIVFRKGLRKWAKQILCLLLVTALVLGLSFSYWLPEVRSFFGSLENTVFTFVYADSASNIQSEFENEAGESFAVVDYIETLEDHMDFCINGNALRIIRDNEHSSFVIADGDTQQVYVRELEGREGVFELLDPRFHDYVTLALMKTEDKTGVTLTTRYEGGHIKWNFLYDGTGFRYLNRFGKLVSLNSVPHSTLFKDSFGSGRGRIWNTTIPLLKNYIAAGSGADTYCFAFPQNDYATLYNTRDGLSLVTDKAHNLYMQYWVNTGLISLLAWLALVGYYLVGAAGQFRKRGFADLCDFVNGGIFCGVIGFLAVAFFNDGSVNTMPMFYTMLGTGLAINMKDKWVKTEEASGKGKKEAAMPEI